MVTPKMQTTVTPLGTHTMPWRAGPAGPLRYEVETVAGGLRIRASYERECSRVTYQINDVRREETADLYTDPDPPDTDAGMVAALMLVPVSMMITAAVVASNPTNTTRIAEIVHIEHDECPVVAAQLALTFRMPSGATVGVTTDESGLATVPVPYGEPVAGYLTVVARGPQRHLQYDLRSTAPMIDRIPCVQWRDEALVAAKRIKDVKARSAARRAAPACAPTS